MLQTASARKKAATLHLTIAVLCIGLGGVLSGYGNLAELFSSQSPSHWAAIFAASSLIFSSVVAVLLFSAAGISKPALAGLVLIKVTAAVVGMMVAQLIGVFWLCSAWFAYRFYRS
jgi:hypothetical protein